MNAGIKMLIGAIILTFALSTPASAAIGDSSWMLVFNGNIKEIGQLIGLGKTKTAKKTCMSLDMKDAAFASGYDFTFKLRMGSIRCGKSIGEKIVQKGKQLFLKIKSIT